MRTYVAALTAVSGLAFALVSLARANPVPDPVYTFCETEDNDLCSNPQILDANLAAASVGGGAEGEFVRDCFYLTGKLQQDCVWDIEPKCAIKVYDKPAPCRTTSGAVIPGNFYEPILRSSNGEDLINVVPLSDRTIRLGVAALQDAFDGTINGLANNGPHNETGEVTVKIFYHTGGDGQPRGDQPDQSYVFRFGGDAARLTAEAVATRGGGDPPVEPADCDDAVGADALRVAFIIPSNVSSVDIVCCNNTGQQAVCYDVDHYKITNLIPGKFYDIEVVGGLDELSDAPGCGDCGIPTNTKLGWFDKNCNLIAFDDNLLEVADFELGSPISTSSIDLSDFYYSKIFAETEEDGSLRFAVSGGGYSSLGALSQVLNSPIPPSGTGGTGTPADTLVSSTTASTGVDSQFALDRVVFVELAGINHTWVGDLTIRLRHVESGKVVTLLNRPGVGNGDAFGDSSNVSGAYIFSNVPVSGMTPHDFVTAAGAVDDAHAVPPGVYLPFQSLDAFTGDLLSGTWTLEITDSGGGDTGSFSTGWLIGFAISNHGDCDFDGLNDLREPEYFDLLDRLRIVDGLNFVYREGASTKDASVDDVIRYPRSIWDPASNQNLHGENFLATYGGSPEAYFAHGVCGGYCIKVQLAEHVDPGERPASPGVMNSARADINGDGVVNASDLALLLSYWGIVQ